MDASKQAYTDYEWAVKLNRLSLTMMGVWPENNIKTKKKLISDIRVIIMINLVIWVSIIPSIHSLVKIWGDIMLMIDNLQYTLPSTMAVIKFFIMWKKQKDILPLLNMIKNDWLKSKTDKQRNVMIKRAQISRTLAIFGIFIMIISFILAAALPVFGISMRYVTNKTDPDKLMPLQTYYVYDRDKSPFYEFTYIMQSLSLFVSAIIYTSTDSLLGLLVIHVCGQLENFKAYIINLDKCGEFRGVLSYVAKHHMRLIRSINIIDNIFTLMLLGAFIYFGILFAFYGFLFYTIINQGRNLSVPRLTFIIMVFVNTFTHTCLYCAVGEILVAQCEGVYEAICEYKWYSLEPKEAKNLSIIMIQAQKPLYLTAGKLFPVTMATLCNLLKTSAGYISVLLAQRE